MTSRNDSLALDQQVSFTLSVATRSVTGLYRRLLDPLGLTHPQYLVMLAFWQHGTLGVKDLSNLLRLDPGTLSPLIKRLEARGLLVRKRDPHDDRALAIELTAAGRALRRKAAKVPGTILAELDLDPQGAHDLRAALDEVIGRADRALDNRD